MFSNLPECMCVWAGVCVCMFTLAGHCIRCQLITLVTLAEERTDEIVAEVLTGTLHITFIYIWKKNKQTHVWHVWVWHRSSCVHQFEVKLVQNTIWSAVYATVLAHCRWVGSSRIPFNSSGKPRHTKSATWSTFNLCLPLWSSKVKFPTPSIFISIFTVQRSALLYWRPVVVTCMFVPLETESKNMLFYVDPAFRLGNTHTCIHSEGQINSEMCPCQYQSHIVT